MPETQAGAQTWRGVATRTLVAASALALILTLVPGAAQHATLANLQDRISTTRNGQLWAETTMRQADGVVAGVRAQLGAEKRALKQTKKKLKRTKQRRASASVRAAASKRAYESAYRIRRKAEANGTTATISKRKIVKLRAAMRRDRKTRLALGNMVGRIQVAKKAKKRRIGAVKRQLGSAVARREGAEATLRGNIANMTRLAHERVAVQVDVQSTRDGTTFTWPTDGRISQRYGCTGFRFNPRRGSCAHFHDGIDIANRTGTPIRSMAAGVVAYVGWNPSDIRGRAFIVIVAHPGGLTSLYGHMLPVRRVRAGQVVRKGELIARMGSTGNSTGSHLHVELQRGSTPLDPNLYFPDQASRPARKKPRKQPEGQPSSPDSPDLCGDRPGALEAAVTGSGGLDAVVSLAGFLANDRLDDCESVDAEEDGEPGRAETARTAASASDPIETGPTIRARSSSPRPQ